MYLFSSAELSNSIFMIKDYFSFPDLFPEIFAIYVNVSNTLLIVNMGDALFLLKNVSIDF